MSRSSKESNKIVRNGFTATNQSDRNLKSKKKKSAKKYDIVTDLNVYPSYEKYRVPYYVVCEQRYENAKKKYDEQFLYELKMQEAMQPCAYDAMRFHRHFVITTLWPPLHTKKEVEYTLKMYELNPKQKKRLGELIKEKVI